MEPGFRLMATALSYSARKTVQFCFRFDEKLTEKAQHTQVCEHFEGDFSSNLEQK